MGYLLKNRNNLSVTRNHGSCRRINTNTARWGKMTGLNNDINKISCTRHKCTSYYSLTLINSPINIL